MIFTFRLFSTAVLLWETFWQQHIRHCHPDTDVKFRGSSMTLEFYHDSMWVLKLNKLKAQRPGSGIYYLELMDVKKERRMFRAVGNINSTAFRPIFNSSASLWKHKLYVSNETAKKALCQILARPGSHCWVLGALQLPLGCLKWMLTAAPCLGHLRSPCKQYQVSGKSGARSKPFG